MSKEEEEEEDSAITLDYPDSGETVGPTGQEEFIKKVKAEIIKINVSVVIDDLICFVY